MPKGTCTTCANEDIEMTETPCKECIEKGPDFLNYREVRRKGFSYTKVELKSFPTSPWHLAAKKTIHNLFRLGYGWNSYGSPPPTLDACTAALDVLSLLDRLGLKPERITAHAGGGIAIRINSDIDFECFNDGEAYAFQRDS